MPRLKEGHYIDDNKYERGRPRSQHSNLMHRQLAYEEIYLPNRDKYPLPFSSYIIHHKDCRKRNNSIKNLQIMTEEEHEELHRKYTKKELREQAKEERELAKASKEETKEQEELFIAKSKSDEERAFMTDLARRTTLSVEGYKEAERKEKEYSEKPHTQSSYRTMHYSKPIDWTPRDTTSTERNSDETNIIIAVMIIATLTFCIWAILTQIK